MKKRKSLNIIGVFLSKEIRTGGHIRCLELMEGLAERGNNVKVLLNSILEYNPHHFSGIRLKVNYKRNGFPPASFVFKQRVKDWMVNGNLQEVPDLIIVFGETHLLAAVEIKSRFNITILFGLQSNTVRETSIALQEKGRNPMRLARKLFEFFHYKYLERRITEACDGIVFQSTYDRDDFLERNKNSQGKSYIIGGNIGPPRFTEDSCNLNHSKSVRKILFMGTLGERKGLRYLFDAYAFLWDEGKHDLELHIAGPGMEAQRIWFEEYAKEHGFLESVTFYGRVPSTFPLMSSCDIMVAPSLFDSYPDVVLLALHTGIPVIGSSTGGIPDMLKYDDLLVPPGDGEAIASVLLRCLDEPGYYSKLREFCNSRREKFLFNWPEAWEQVAAKVVRE